MTFSVGGFGTLRPFPAALHGGEAVAGSRLQHYEWQQVQESAPPALPPSLDSPNVSFFWHYRLQLQLQPFDEGLFCFPAVAQPRAVPH